MQLSLEEAEKQYPGPSEFTHLHIHTQYSQLDGIASPEDYFRGCAERKYPAIAITEHGVLNSIPDCYFISKETGVKQIIGCEFYYCDYEIARKKLVEGGKKLADIKTKLPMLGNRISRNRHLTILAKNQIGYNNILKINRSAWQDFFYRKPRINFDLLSSHKEGLIVLSGCMNGPVSFEISEDNLDGKKSGVNITGAVEYVKKFKQVFGEDFYIELQMPGVEGEIELFIKLLQLADDFKVKTVLTNDCHYMKREDHKLQKVLMAIDQGITVDDPNLFYVNSSEQYFKSRSELRATFNLNGFIEKVPVSEFEKACDNTLEVASKCGGFKPDLGPKLPKIEDADQKLRQLAYDGLRNKGLDKDESKYLMDEKMVTYHEQLEIELKRIISKGFASYFLITLDLINASRSKGFMIGPGRGSCGGSLLSYLIDIQPLNPFYWSTSFSRFLSPARGGDMLDVTMPK